MFSLRSEEIHFGALAPRVWSSVQPCQSQDIIFKMVTLIISNVMTHKIFLTQPNWYTTTAISVVQQPYYDDCMRMPCFEFVFI